MDDDRAELIRLIAELRKVQAAARPVIREANDRMWANRRMDGPTGFVMVRHTP